MRAKDAGKASHLEVGKLRVIDGKPLTRMYANQLVVPFLLRRFNMLAISNLLIDSVATTDEDGDTFTHASHRYNTTTD
jgi:hypothetical protein